MQLKKIDNNLLVLIRIDFGHLERSSAHFHIIFLLIKCTPKILIQRKTMLIIAFFLLMDNRITFYNLLRFKASFV